MASNDKLWFDFGIREDVSKKLSDIMIQAENLKETLESMKIGQNAISNAAELERALDKISVAKERIAESKGLVTNQKDKDDLREMERTLDKMQKSFEKFAKMGNQLDLAKMGSKGYAKFLEDFNNLALALDQVKRKTGEINAQAKEDERNKEAEAKRVDTLKEKYYELYNIRKNLQDAILSAAPGTDLTNANSQLGSLTARMGAVKRAMSGGGLMPASADGADYDEFIRNVKDETRNLTSATDAYNRSLSTTKDIQSNLQRIMLDTVSQQKIANIRKQSNEYTALGRKLAEIQDLMRKVEDDKQNVLSGSISSPQYTREVVNKELDAIQRRYNEELARGKQLEKEDAEAKNQQAIASKKAADAVQMLAHVNQGLISSYNRIAQAGTEAKNVTIQLQQQMGNYASIYGIERLLKSIITIGGQFEFQHIALQNILGDIQQANTLFGQLQTLAVESPKTFMELTAYTKQLSAYQIPYEELFDTTKRLADLSTGLGIDMSRLILAYGQVRSASVLRGQELRQFTEAGIPLVQKLAEEFTRLNGKATTTGDVFELISKRAVPFKMVQKILWDMTNEGGQFYNMQSELADTLYGKWQKLQDQWQITLGHIADGNTLSGRFFKNMLEGLVKVASMFDTLLPMFGMFGLGKAGSMMFASINAAVNKRNGTTAINNMQLAKEQEANRLMRERVMYGRQLTAEEMRIVNERGKLTSQDYYLLGVEKQISAQKAHQLFLDGKMDKLHYYKLLKMQGYTYEQRKQILQGNTQLLQNSVGGGLGSEIFNFMGGWLGIASAAVGTIASLYSNAQSKAEEAKNAASTANEAILQGLKDANSLYNELTNKQPDTEDGRLSAIERMTNALKENGQYTDELQAKIANTDNSIEKYTLLYEALQNVSSEYLRLKDNLEAYLEAANRVGEGNWFTKMFNDPMSKDLKDWSEANINKNAAVKGIEKYGSLIRKELVRTLKESGKWVKAEMKNMNVIQLLGKFNMYDSRLRQDSLVPKDADEKTVETYKKMTSAIWEYYKAVEKVQVQEAEVNSQFDEYFNRLELGLESRAKSANLDFSELNTWGEKDLRNLTLWINEIINSYNLEGDTAERLRNKIIAKFPKQVVAKIKVLPALEEQDLAPWQDNLKKYFDSNKINIPVDVQSSLEKIEKDLQNKKQEFQEQMDRSGGILIRFGFDTSNLPTDIEKALESVPVWMRDYVRKAFTDYNEGKEGVGKIDQAGKDTGLKVDKTKKSTSTDKQLKQWREELKELQEFWREYENLLNRMTSDQAVEEIRKNGLFPTLFKGGKTAIDVRAGLGKSLSDLLSKTNGKTSERKALQVDIKKARFEVEQKDAQEAVDAALKKLDEELKKKGKEWNLYKKILEATGDKQQAAQIAFGKQVSFGNFVEELRAEITKELAGNEKAKGVDIDTLLGMDEKQLRDEYDIFGSLVHKLKELKEVEQQLKSEDADLFLNALKNAKSLETELAQIKVEFDNIRRVIAGARNLSPEEKKKRTENANNEQALKEAATKWDWFKKNNADWGVIFGNLEKASTKALRKMKADLEKQAPAIREDVKATKELYEAIEKIDNLLVKRNPFKAMGDSFSKIANLKEILNGVTNTNGMYSISDEKAMSLGLKVNDKAEYSDKEIREALKAAGKDFEAGAMLFVDNVNSLPDLVDAVGLSNTEFGEGVKEFAEGTNHFANAIKNWSNGNYVGAITEGIKGLQSYGNLVERIGGFSFNGSNEDEINSTIADLSAVNERLSNRIKELTDKIGSSAGIKAINASNTALKLQKEREDNIRKMISAKMDYHASHHSFGSYWNGFTKEELDLINDQLEVWEQFDGDLRNLTANQAKAIVNSEELRSKIANTGESYYGEAVLDYIEMLADEAGEAEEITKRIQDNLTQTSFEGMRDSFLDALLDMEKSAKDFANDIKKIMYKALVNSLVLNDDFDAWLNNWLKDYASAVENDDTAGINKLNQQAEEEFARRQQLAERYANALGLSSGSSSSSSGIKGVTEQTADLIASYINQIRADVSVNRATLQQILAQMIADVSSNAPSLNRSASSAPSISEAQQYAEAAGLTDGLTSIAQAQLEQLRLIVGNTGRNVDLVQEVRDMLHRVTLGGDAVKVK